MRKSLYGFILACLFVTGCGKDDKPAAPNTTTEGGGDTANTQPGTTGSGRSGKVDLGTRRRDRPGLPADTANGSGSDQTSKESVEDRRSRRMEQFDTDGDGKISDAERKQARHKRAEEMRKKADTNGDGKVSVEELQASSGGFRRMDPATVDTNKDGDISVEELEVALEARANKWGGDRRMGRNRERVRRGGSGGPEAPAPNGGEQPK